jgi:16S rRNA processing protein RimM
MERKSNSTSATSTASAEAPAVAWDDMLLVGVVARTQGNRGEVIVNATTDFVDDRFGEDAVLWGRRVPDGAVERLQVTQFRMHLGRPVVVFGGVASINDAERFTGWELRVPPDTARQLPAHVYYHHELVGCAVWTAAGEQVGAVASVDGEGEAVRLVVATAGGPVLVPLTQAFCTVDVAARRITIDPPEGLLEVNGGWRA